MCGVSTIIVGELNGIRDGKGWGNRESEKSQMAFDLIIKMLTRKDSLKVSAL